MKATTQTPAFKIISTKEILQPNVWNAGPRIGRVQVVQVGDVVEEHTMWFEGERLHHIDTKRISATV